MTVRVAALGDPHAGVDTVGFLRPALADVAAHADLLLIAGDLTRHGEPDEATVLAGEVCGLGVPVVTVLGNHDHEGDQEDKVRAVMEDAGVVVLEGESTVLDVRGTRVGIAGAKGFGGGFRGACGTEFGEREMKAFVGHTRAIAERLGDALGRALGSEVQVTPRGDGYRVTLAFESLDEAQALADRLGALEHA